MKRRAFFLAAFAAVFIPKQQAQAGAIIDRDAALKHYSAVNDFPSQLFDTPAMIIPGKIMYMRTAEWRMLP